MIRLGVMWESVETAPGVYDQTYLASVNSLVDKLGKNGIYTIVDAHQDLFSRLNCGEGVPSFYIEDLPHECPFSPTGIIFDMVGRCKSIASYNFTKDKNGWPLTDECKKHPFEHLYTAPEVAASFA